MVDTCPSQNSTAPSVIHYGGWTKGDRDGSATEQNGSGQYMKAKLFIVDSGNNFLFVR